MDKEKIQHFKKRLEAERDRLEKDLTDVAQKNPQAPGDWEMATPEPIDMPADPSELSDTFEELGNAIAMEDNLEEQLTEINQALERIKKNKFGLCEICGKEIEEKRLEASPSAKYCIKDTKNR